MGEVSGDAEERLRGGGKDQSLAGSASKEKRQRESGDSVPG